jgi:hypothetical protein
MSTNIKKRNYRKKREDTPEDSPAPGTSTETGAVEDGSTAQEDEPEGLRYTCLPQLRFFIFFTGNRELDT